MECQKGIEYEKEKEMREGGLMRVMGIIITKNKYTVESHP